MGPVMKVPGHAAGDRVYTGRCIVKATPLDYAAWRATALGATTERLERAAVLDLAGSLAGRDVLDVGCGDGAYALAVARLGARAAGVDPAPEAVEAARRHAAEAGLDATFQVGSAERLPFEAGRFDVVLAVTVLCFIRNPPAAVAEMARVLRPGGVLVIGDLGRWSPWTAWRRLRAWAGDATWGGAQFWTVRELRALLRTAGLEPGRARAAVFYPPLGLAARLMAPLDEALGRRTTLGAAFVAVGGRKEVAAGAASRRARVAT